MKIVWPVVFVSLIVFLLIAGYFSKDKLNNLVSEKISEQVTVADSVAVASYVDEKYNYSSNGLDYDFTLLEFSADNCTPCKQMKPVLEEIAKNENPKVNVVFLNTMQPQNLPLMKYYGISAMPIQILLDKSGNEFYRHYGVISATDLLTKMN